MRATMYGYEIVWPCPIGSAASAYARRRSAVGTNDSRGTLAIASSTRSSSISRARSCRSTICRRSGGIRVRGDLDAKVLERERREVDDSPRLGLEPDGQHRDQRVPRLQRAVAAAAEMAAPGQVGQLDAERRRDEQLAGVRVRERGPRALERVRLVEQRTVAARPPVVRAGREAELLAVTPRDRLGTLAVEDDLGRRRAVQPPRELGRLLAAGRQAVDHPRAVGGGHEDAVDGAQRGLERDRAIDAG